MSLMQTKTSGIKLLEHQKEPISKLRTGSILVGGVGSGKSLVAILYYLQNEAPKDLYIITTSKKRDSQEWQNEYPFPDNLGVKVDSWNNIHKYSDVKNAFFIFDEQRLVGNGVWVKSFLKITKSNNWILLSATPGDTWMDYVPVFIANGWYRNRTEFIRRHVVYNNFSKFPKVDHYVDIGRLNRLRKLLLVEMNYKKKTISHDEFVPVPFDRDLYDTVAVKRWDVYEHKPIENITQLFYLMRRVVNSDSRRVDILSQLLNKHPKAIVFYNFDYELALLLAMARKMNITVSQWNGHRHEPIPDSDSWVYLVQYSAGAEGWNCVLTNVVIFFSLNYSYRIRVQAAGRIDRLNTPFKDLYYYSLISKAPIDLAIHRAIRHKRAFNERNFIKVMGERENIPSFFFASKT